MAVPNRGRRRRVARTQLVVVMATLAFVVGCGDGGGAALPACADDLPVPEGLDVVDTPTGPGGSGSASAGPGTSAADPCVVTFAGDLSLDETVQAWGTALDAAGWDHAVQPGDGRSTFLRLRHPACGLVMVFAPGRERVAAEVPNDRTPTLVSLLPCELLPDQPTP